MEETMVWLGELNTPELQLPGDGHRAKGGGDLSWGRSIWWLIDSATATSHPLHELGIADGYLFRLVGHDFDGLPQGFSNGAQVAALLEQRVNRLDLIPPCCKDIIYNLFVVLNSLL